MGIEGNISRTFAALMALIGWVGLVVQFFASLDQTGSAAAAAWVMLRYFTVLTNVLVAVTMTGLALGRPAFRSPALLGGVTLSIVLVGAIYGLLLRGLLELSGGAKLADTALHIVVPIVVPFFWLAFAPKGRLTFRDPFLWSVYPIAYVVYALIRGTIENKYAYPFIDVARIGWAQTAMNTTVIAVGFLIVGCAIVGLDRLHGRRSRES
jgi:hypothetical protein